MRSLRPPRPAGGDAPRSGQSRPRRTHPTQSGASAARQLLAREWARTAVASLSLAILAGAIAVAENSRTLKGDLVVGLYFASVSLLFWLRSVSLTRGRAVKPSGNGYLIAMTLGLGIGGVLIAADVLTAGRL